MGETCAQCGQPVVVPIYRDGLPFCSEGCLMGATAKPGNTSGIDPSLIGGEDPTR